MFDQIIWILFKQIETTMKIEYRQKDYLQCRMFGMVQSNHAHGH